MIKTKFFFKLFALCVAVLIAGPVWAAPLIQAEVNPNPVQPGEMMDTQITVSNPTGSATGTLVLRVLWPAGLEATPVAPGSNNCVTNCQAGEFLVWELGILGPGTSVAVSFNALVNNLADGTVIPIEIDLSEATIEVATLSLSVEVQSDSQLEIAVDPLSDPVVSGAMQVYEVVYGNSSDASAENAMLDFPIPAGTQFVSATGGGVFAAGNVSWSLGSMAPGSGGRERVTVQVDALDDASLILVDAATISGDLNFQSQESRAMAVSRVDSEQLQLKLEVNPDPVNANQMMDAQIAISNPTGSATGSLVLQVLWPQQLEATPVAPGSNNCVTNCQAGEFLVWDLGVLGPGVSRAVSFNAFVKNRADGTLVPLEVELIESGLSARNLSHTALIQSDSPLEIAVDPLSDPVVSGAMQVYEVVYGNSSDASAENTMLDFPIPAGTQFVSATGDGVFTAGNVSWSLGSMAPGSGGRERVTVQVDALDGASLIHVDAATISGDLNFQLRESRAMAVSRVDTELLQLKLEINPSPVNANQMMDSQITVSNPTGSATGSLVLQVLWPEELKATPVAPDSNQCVTNCQTGEYLVWNLGVLGPGASRAVSFNAFVNNRADGTLVPLEVELIESGLPALNQSHTVMIQSDSPLEIAVDPVSDPVASGALLVYEVVYGNSSDSSAENAMLDFPIPAGTQFVSATGGGVFAAGNVSWSLGSLAPHSGGRERVTVQLNVLDDTSLIQVDAATISGDLNFKPRESRAMAVSRVGTEPLQLGMTVDRNPILANEVLNVELSVTNPTGSATGGLTLQVLWPEELHATPTAPDSNNCVTNCQTGEYLVWDLGVLGPGVTRTVNFSENVRSLVNGTLIPLEVELIEADFPARNESESILLFPFVDFDNDGEADVFDDDDDNDGMPDWWEILHGLDPFDDGDAGDDPDEDGVTNLQEYLGGTDPNVHNNRIFEDGFESDDEET